MIEIKKVTDLNLAKQICADNEVEWKPEYHIIATIENGNVLHCAVFSYDKDIGQILVISGFDGDIYLLDGLCRAILNIMDINNVKDVYLPRKYEKIAQKIGFDTEENRYHLKLEGFFKCSCNKRGE